MIFPLGMYVAVTWGYAESADFPFLKPLAYLGIYFAWAAWTLTAFGTLCAILTGFRGIAREN